MSDCIFCKIVAGQIKPKLAYQNDTVLSFWDINPQAPVHLLIIPKKHVERVSTLHEQEFSLVADIHKAAVYLANEHKMNGFRLVTNNGEGVGQTVQHLHYHLLSGRDMKWPPG